MNQACFRRSFWVIAVLLALGVSSGAAPAVLGQEPAPAPSRVFMPYAQGNTVRKTIFGVDMTQATPERNLNGVRTIGSAFVRRGNMWWSEIEPVEGAGYNWAAPRNALLEAEMRNITALGMEPIVIIRSNPRWATAPNPNSCAPINPAKYFRFAAFVSEAVKRYSAPPYNVKYWEIYNEPDAPIGSPGGFDCWGVPGDPYFGGRAFGDMLKLVYPQIKAANPQALVLNGSLLLDRPNTPPAQFLEGMLRSGAGGSFDIMGYHAYCYYQNANNPDGVDARGQSCATNAQGISDWKAPYIRDVFKKVGVPAKPLFNTETALLCAGGADCRNVQADWVGRNFARALRDGLSANIWFLFDSDGFRSTALVEPGNPFATRPAYGAFRQASLMLGESQYLGTLTGQPGGVEGHRFGRNGEITTIVWSNTTRNVSIPIAAGAVPTCLSRDGQPIACSSGGTSVTLSIGRSPVYVIGR